MKQTFTILTIVLLNIGFGKAQSFVGNYEREKDFMDAPSVLLLKSDGKFELVTGGTSIRGTYTVAADKITFTDESGDYADTYAGGGIYSVKNDGRFSFTVVKDKAIQRKDILKSSAWRKLDSLKQN